MESSSSIRWAVWKKSKPSSNSEENNKALLLQFGVTEQLQGFVKAFTKETFKNFSPPASDGRSSSLSDGFSKTSSSNTRDDLTEWQERHATLVLSTVKELSQLRYVLCPRHLKDEQFWRIYFALVKSYVTPYEKRAIQEARLKMQMEEKSMAESAYEVEMTEAKPAKSAPPLSVYSESAPG